MKILERLDELIEATQSYTIPSKKGVVETSIPPTKRSFRNLPKYADGKPRVRFQDWLLIKGQKKYSDSQVNTFGKSEANGKWYGWSHRAVAGFGIGEELKGKNMGKKVTYPKLEDGSTDWDNGNYEPDFVIKTEEQAKECALRFAKSVQ